MDVYLRRSVSSFVPSVRLRTYLKKYFFVFFAQFFAAFVVKKALNLNRSRMERATETERGDYVYLRQLFTIVPLKKIL
jgi:hypothetical protein